MSLDVTTIEEHATKARGFRRDLKKHQAGCEACAAAMQYRYTTPIDSRSQESAPAMCHVGGGLWAGYMRELSPALRAVRDFISDRVGDQTVEGE